MRMLVIFESWRSPSVALLGLALFFIAILGRRVLKRRAERRGIPRLPPGPKGWPVIGNFFDIPHEQGWLKYASMSKQYGDMVYLESFGQSILILNSFRRANDLLDKRSSNCSSKPWSLFLHDLMGWGWAFGFMPYGDAWRRRRRLLHNHLHPVNMGNHHPVQVYATRIMLRDILEEPDRFAEHAIKHAGTIILKTMYGHDVQRKHDSLVELVESGQKLIMEATAGGSYLVDSFPVLRHIPTWFPGANFRRFAEESRAISRRVLNKPFNDAKTRMETKGDSHCLVSSYLAELETRKDVLPDEEDVIKESAAMAYLAGADTTASAIMTFILAMVLYPDIQARAHAELDCVVGRNRLPTFEDKPDLPYLHCIQLETLRWQPVVPNGVAHKNVSDEIYDGFLISAGTIITPNNWAMLHDEEVYPDPETFNPDRFNVKEGEEALPPQADPSSIAFGFGRRYLANDTIWIGIASILSTFTITNALDEDGEVIIPKIAYTDGLVSYPKSFRCRFISRSEHILGIVQSDD